MTLLYPTEVGENARKRQLYAIASDKRKNVIAVEDFGTLQDAMRQAVGRKLEIHLQSWYPW